MDCPYGTFVRHSVLRFSLELVNWAALRSGSVGDTTRGGVRSRTPNPPCIAFIACSRYTLYSISDRDMLAQETRAVHIHARMVAEQRSNSVRCSRGLAFSPLPPPASAAGSAPKAGAARRFRHGFYRRTWTRSGNDAGSSDDAADRPGRFGARVDGRHGRTGTGCRVERLGRRHARRSVGPPRRPRRHPGRRRRRLRAGRGYGAGPGPYTHLKLPTISSVETSVVADT